MRLRAIALVSLLGLIWASLGAALQPATKIIAQPDAPIAITSYSAAYRERTNYSQEGIQHSVEYRNNSGKVVDAVEIGLVSFDVWNEFLNRTGGISLETLAPGASKKGLWIASAYADFSFLTGVAYVRRVRFRDGSIWSVDLNAIAQELSSIESGFDVTRLKEKEKEKE